jgi:hypothetical protein
MANFDATGVGKERSLSEFTLSTAEGFEMTDVLWLSFPFRAEREMFPQLETQSGIRIANSDDAICDLRF